LRAIRGIKNTRLLFFITKLSTKEVSFSQQLFQILLVATIITTDRKFTNVNSALGSVFIICILYLFSTGPFSFLIFGHDMIKTRHNLGGTPD
jgi:hypothetical protein